MFRASIAGFAGGAVLLPRSFRHLSPDTPLQIEIAVDQQRLRNLEVECLNIQKWRW
jgi:hypothetical protein